MGKFVLKRIRAIATAPKRIDTTRRSEYLGRLQEWNARLGDHLRFIRILEAMRWPNHVEQKFFARNCAELPCVSTDDYRHSPSLNRLPERLADLRQLEREIASQLGPEHPAARLLLRRCRGAQVALRLISARGTREFVWLSREIFGSSLASRSTRERLLRLIAFLDLGAAHAKPAERMSAEAAARELGRRMVAQFGDSGIRVKVSDSLNSDACAGCGYLKLRRNAGFTSADIDLLEVHEGWVHLGTMLNGRRQPVFSILGKSAPCVTETQEGLAVLAELTSGVCHPVRRLRLSLRIRAVIMAEDGADFLQVFRFFREGLADVHDAYRQTARVFRGSLPSGMGPFTKDLSYGLGLLNLVTCLRSLPDEEGRAVPLLFSGKTCLDDLPDLAQLHDAGLLLKGEFVPPTFRDGRHLRQVLRDICVW